MGNRKPGEIAFPLDKLPAILEACQKSGVAVLKFGDLEVSFHPLPAAPLFADTLGATSQVALPDPYRFPASPASEQTRIEPVDPELLEDMRRAQLMIDDPMAFEQEMVDEHLRRGSVDERQEAYDD